MAFSSEFMAYFYLFANKNAHKSFIESNKILTLKSSFLTILEYVLEKELVLRTGMNVKLLGKKKFRNGKNECKARRR